MSEFKVYQDKNIEGDYEIIASGIPEPKMHPGIFYAPYIPLFVTERPMEDEYSTFMRKYDYLHRCCPECGSDSNVQTLVGYVLDLSKKEEYADRNGCTCCSCGWTGIVHELVKPNED